MAEPQRIQPSRQPDGQGWRHVLWLVAFKPYEGLARLLLFPIRWLPESWLPRTRFLRTVSERIGHLAPEPDIFLKELQLGLRPPGRYLWVIRPGKVCNACLLDYWREHFTIYDRGLARFLLLPLARQRRLGLELHAPMIAHKATVAHAAVQTQWGNRPPILQLHDEQRRRGAAAMAQLGLPPDAWFVCLHNREPGYLPEHKYGDDYRNADVRTHIPALEEIVRRGGWCVRMGDPAMTPLPPLRNVIDYAHSPAKSDWLDIYLCAACRFMIACPSGLGYVSAVFGRPVAQANAAPLGMILFYGPQDLSIAKLYVDRATGREWTFPEIFRQPAANVAKGPEFPADRVRFRDNTPEEILEMVTDMFDQLEGRPQSEADCARQQKFLSLMKPGDYSYGSPGRVAPSFLRRYEHLLDDSA
jgi:putative glycosyltransferase (TIGR04372 family)